MRWETRRAERMVRGTAGQVGRAVRAGLVGVGTVLVVLLLVCGGSVGAEQTGGETASSSSSVDIVSATMLSPEGASYLNCRFGVGQSENPVTSYDIAPLNLGWYANWRAQLSPAQPAGIEHVQVLRVNDGAGYGEREHPAPPSYSPSGDTLDAIVAANPGSLWLVGNEPDCIWQDNVLPENYAVAYHDAYVAIKTVDPTAKVSVGGIVQPTPLRFHYLEAVLDAHIARYGSPLPTDAWNIHTYILREERGGWGSEIPPGSTADEGRLYELDDTDDIEIFQERIREFRRWMHRHGYRDTPLIITEYGTLLPYWGLDPKDYYKDSEGEPFDEDRAREFMYDTFDFLLRAADAETGYPADENRLVQRWLWYSLDDVDYGGLLFDPNTTDPTALGVSLSEYTGAISSTVDLLAVEVSQVGPTPLSPTDTATITLEAEISNVGNVAVTEPITVRLFDEKGQRIGEDVVLSDTLSGCAETGSAAVIWSDVASGAHSIRVVVDPEDEIREGDETNNEAYGVALVAEHQVFLPLTSRRW